MDENYSTNCGVEGPTQDPSVLACREALKRSLISTLFLSQGVPMLLGGDELSRTQHGNNNAYCQDNEISWYNWQLDERKQQFLEFVRQAIWFRKQHRSFRRRHFLTGLPNGGEAPDAVWWHPEGRPMRHEDWTNPELTAFGLLLHGDAIQGTDEHGRPFRDDTFLILFNNGSEAVPVVVPEVCSCGKPHHWEVVPVFQRNVAPTTCAPGETLSLPPGVLTVLVAVPPFSNGNPETA